MDRIISPRCFRRAVDEPKPGLSVGVVREYVQIVFDFVNHKCLVHVMRAAYDRQGRIDHVLSIGDDGYACYKQDDGKTDIHHRLGLRFP